MTIDIYFLDAGRTAHSKSDPVYPEGRRINLAKDRPTEETMTWNLPWPAPRKGMYRVICRSCGHSGSFAVSGQPDDPRTVTLPCGPICRQIGSDTLQ